MKRTGIVFVGHGSRDQAANQEFEATVANLQRRKSNGSIGYGYIEFAEPLLKDALEKAAKEFDRVIVLPFFLFEASHVKRDIPAAVSKVQSNFPHVQFKLLPFVGLDSEIISIAADRLSHFEDHKDTLAVFVGRGSNDPLANKKFKDDIKEMECRQKGFICQPAFISISPPFVDEILKRITQKEFLYPVQRLVVVPYFLFRGILVSRLAEKLDRFADLNPHIRTEISPPLGTHLKFFELINKQISEGIKGFVFETKGVSKYA